MIVLSGYFFLKASEKSFWNIHRKQKIYMLFRSVPSGIIAFAYRSINLSNGYSERLQFKIKILKVNPHEIH